MIGSFRLESQTIGSVQITWRVVECREPARAGKSRQRARLASGQVTPFGRELRIRLQKGCLDVELVRVSGDTEDAFHVLGGESGVCDISDALPRTDTERLLLESTEPHAAALGDRDHRVVHGTVAHRALGDIQPWADRQPKLVKRGTRNIHAQAFLKAECEARRAVIEGHAFNPEIRLEQNAAGAQIGWSTPTGVARAIASTGSRPRAEKYHRGRTPNV